MSLASVAAALRLVRRFTALPRGERRLMARAAAAHAMVIAGIRVPALAGPAMRGAARAARTSQPVDAAIRRVTASSAIFGALSTCLSRALTIQACAGEDAAVTRIGVRQNRSGTLEAHAWVECRGATSHPESSGYRPIARWDGRRWQRS